MPKMEVLEDCDEESNFSDEDDGMGTSSCSILPTGPVNPPQSQLPKRLPKGRRISPQGSPISVTKKKSPSQQASNASVPPKKKSPSIIVNVPRKKLDFSKLRYSDDGPDIEQIFTEVKLHYPDLFQPLKTEEGETVFMDRDIVKAGFPGVKIIGDKYKQLKKTAWNALLGEIKEVPRPGETHFHINT